jgi:PAS domain S-box-containing protein
VGDLDSAGEARMSLHRLLTRLIWMCAGPLILLAVYLAFSSVMTKQTERDLEAANLAKSFATLIDQHLHARISALHMLAASPLVDDASRWRDLYREAQGFHQGFGSHVILADPEMYMLFNTRVPFGTKLPVLPRPKGHAAAPTVLKTGKPAVGDVFPGPIAREPLVAIAVPALREGKPRFLLLTIFETRQFQKRLDQTALPSGWAITLLDGKDEAIARRAPQDMNSVTDVDASGRFVVKSTVSPWSVVLEIPRDIYRKPLIEAAAALAIAILSVTLVSLLAGLLVSRRLGKAVASLVETGAPGAPASDIAEIAAVKGLLDESAEKRKRSETEAQETGAKLKAALDSMTDAVFISDTEGRFIDFNEAFATFHKFGNKEECPKTLSEYPALLDVYKASGEPAPLSQWPGPRALRGETASNVEYRLRRKDTGETWAGSYSFAPIRNKEGTIVGSVIVGRDITENKRAEYMLRQSEATVRNKLKAITEPEGDISTLELSDIIDTEVLQSIMEDFYRFTGMLGAVLDVSGKILVAVGWQDICTKFHRCHPDTLKNCIESDTILTNGVPAGTFKAYRCKNNMWDMVTPLMVGGRHVGNVFIGQFFYEDEMPDLELFREQARRYGFDATKYLAALERAPRFSRETVDAGMRFYARLAGIISTLSFGAIQQSRMLAEREQAEAALRDSEGRYRSLFENMVEGFAYCRMLFENGRPADYIYLDVNKAFISQTGLTDVIGRKVSDIIPGVREADPALFERLGRVALTGRPDRFEIYLAALKTWFSLSVYSPAKEHFVAVFDVITERKRVEEALAASEKEFRSLAESMPQIVWVCQPDGNNIYFNQQWIHYTGLSLEESYGAGWNIPFHPDDQQRAWDAWQNAVTNNAVYSLECRLRRYDGEYFWWLIRGVPVLNEKGEIMKWFGSCTDIDELKRAEEEVQKLNAELEQRVADRTAELATKTAELERVNKVFVGRELRMRELKEQIAELEKKRS